MVRQLRAPIVLGALIAAVAIPLAAAVASARMSANGAAIFVAGQVGGAIRAVTADRETAWIGEGIGVSRIDVRNPDFLRLMGHTVVAEEADVWSLAQSLDRLYVGSTAGLHVLDIHDAAEPIPIASLPMNETIRALTAVTAGDGSVWLFAVAPGAGAVLFEILADGTPRPAFAVAGTAGATAPVAVDGPWAVAPGDNAHVIDIRDIAHPVEVATIRTPGHVRGAAVRDGVAYLSDDEAGLIVVRLSSHPDELGRVGGIGPGRTYANGDYVYVLEQGPRGSALRLVDVSDPSNPSDPLGGESTYAALGGTMDLVPLGDRLVAARGAMLSAADVTSVLWPELKNEYVSVWPILQLADSGGCVYTAKGPSGLDVVDARYPQGANVAVSWRPPGGTFGVHTFEYDAFLSMSDGMARFDVRDPCDPIPREVPFGPGWGATRAIATGGNRVVSASAQRLSLADLGGDEPPKEITQALYENIPGWPSGAVPRDVALYQGGVAIVAAGEFGLVLVNLLDGERPSVHRVEAAPEGLSVLSLALQVQTLAVGTSGGLLMYDLHDPFAPRLLGAVPSRLTLLDVDIRNDRVFAAADSDGMVVYDVSQRDDPQYAGAFHPPYAITAVSAGERFVHVAGAGVTTLHVSASNVRPTPTPIAPLPPLTPVPTATSGPVGPSPTASATATATWATPTNGPGIELLYMPLAMR